MYILLAMIFAYFLTTLLNICILLNDLNRVSRFNAILFTIFLVSSALTPYISILPILIAWFLTQLWMLVKIEFNDITVSILKVNIAFLFPYLVERILLPIYDYILSLQNDTKMVFLILSIELLSLGFNLLVIVYLSRLNFKEIMSPTLIKALMISTSLIILLERVYSLISYLFIYPDENRTNIAIIMLISIMILLCICGGITIKFLLDKQKTVYEKVQAEYEVITVKQYANEINKQYESVRMFKHDYVNILSSMEYYIQQEKIESVKDMYYNKLLPTKKMLTGNYSHMEIVNRITIPEIRSLLSTKIILAKNSGTDFHLEIENNFFIPEHYDLIALIRILGIFIDNALEAVQSEHHGKIDIVLFNLDPNALFLIRNPVSLPICNIDAIRQKGFSTKGSDRGIGLSIVNELIEQHDNLLLETLTDDDLFVQKLTILGDCK